MRYFTHGSNRNLGNHRTSTDFPLGLPRLFVVPFDRDERRVDVLVAEDNPGGFRIVLLFDTGRPVYTVNGLKRFPRTLSRRSNATCNRILTKVL